MGRTNNEKNSFDSIIVEKHHTLGGECTGWERQGYHIDGCIHCNFEYMGIIGGDVT